MILYFSTLIFLFIFRSRNSWINDPIRSNFSSNAKWPVSRRWSVLLDTTSCAHRLWFDSSKQRRKSFRHRRMGQDRVTQGHVGQPRGHRDLNDRHDRASVGRKRGEAEDSVAVSGD